MNEREALTEEQINQIACRENGGPNSVVAFARAIEAEVRAALASAPAATQPATVTLDFKQTTELLEMFGGEAGEVTLCVGDGHSGNGLYAYWGADPEGSMFLGQFDDDALPATAETTQPAAAERLAQELREAVEGGASNSDLMHILAASQAPAVVRELTQQEQDVFANALHRSGKLVKKSEAAVAEWEKLRDPAILHANLLRGVPAKLTREQLLHLAGEAPADTENPVSAAGVEAAQQGQEDTKRMNLLETAPCGAVRLDDAMGIAPRYVLWGPGHEHKTARSALDAETQKSNPQEGRMP